MRIVLLSLALMAGTIGTSQQPAEWRPSIAEDNKAATWEDTSAFIINMLTGSGSNYIKAWNGNTLFVSFEDQIVTPKRCLLSERNFHFSNTHLTSVSAIWTIDFAKVDPLSIRVIQNPSLGFLGVMMEGTNAGAIGSYSQGAFRDHVAVDDVKMDHVKPALLETTCSATDKHCRPSDAAEGRSNQERFVDQEAAKRFARAVMHASLLCGGTKSVSPF
jgi:hypothetical protein